MANVVERLFDRIIPDLAKTSRDDPDGWDKIERDAEEGAFGSDDDDLLPFREVLSGDRFADRLFDGRSGPSELSEEEKELVEGGIRERGADALAFYKSRRLLASRPFPGKWGIFYLNEGLRHIAWEISVAFPGYKDPRRLAHDFLYAHEHFHFRADLQILMFEATLRQQLYNPLHKLLAGRASHFVEEALANRQAFEWSSKPGVGVQEFAEEFMSLQPGAYARFNEPALDLAGEWIANVLDLSPPGCQPRGDLAHWVEATPKDLLRTSLCPQYVIYPRTLTNWLRPAWVPPPVREVVDDDAVKQVLASKYRSLQSKWDETKRKLQENRLLRGLDFKKWPNEGKGAYSVRVDKGFRAHLRNQGNGVWLAYDLGSHKEMGHG